MKTLFVIMAGDALGAGGRYLVSNAFLRLMGPGFPWGTFAVNVVGCFLMGVLIETLARKGGVVSGDMSSFLATGVLGGFTTFSAFSLDTAVLWERGTGELAFAYVLASVPLSIAALFAGLWLVRQLAG